MLQGRAAILTSDVRSAADSVPRLIGESSSKSCHIVQEIVNERPVGPAIAARL